MSKDTLKIRVEDIPPEGRKVHVEEPFLEGKNPQGTYDTRSLGMETQAPIRADLETERVGTIVRIRGLVHFPYTMPCARSNEPVPCEFSEPLDITLRQAAVERLPAGSKAGDSDDEDEGIALTQEEMDDWTYTGEEIDLGPILYEHIALNLPVKVVAERFKNAPELAYSDGEAPDRQKPFEVLKGLKIEKP